MNGKKKSNTSIINVLILNEMLEKTNSVIESVAKKLPATFPHHISDSILLGLEKAKQKLGN